MRTQDCSTLVVLLAVATTAHAAQRDRPAPSPAAFRFIPEANCSGDRFGNLQCQVPGYQPIDTADTCPPDAPVFGSVFNAGGATLLDRFPETDARPVALLHDHQFVCIAAEAAIEPGAAAWSYVIAVPTHSVPDCRSEALCRDADFAVHWIGHSPTTPCRLYAEGRYTSGCAASWVRSDLIDPYTMGIKPVGD